MFFLVRCAFWLSIVYGSIFWSHGAFSWNDEGVKAVEAAHAGAKRLVAKAASGVADLCAGHAGECLADAAKLSSLVQAAVLDPAGDAPAAREPVAETVVPLPIPDPRRHNRDAKRPHAP